MLTLGNAERDLARRPIAYYPGSWFSSPVQGMDTAVPLYMDFNLNSIVEVETGCQPVLPVRLTPISKLWTRQHVLGALLQKR